MAKAPTFFERHAQNAIIGAVVASVLSLFGSGLSVYLTYHYSVISQDRQVRIEQISKFDGAGTSLVEAAGVFIAAINTNNEIELARLKVRTVVAGQIQDTEILRKTFDGKVSRLIDQYQKALSEFNSNTDRIGSATEMRPWAESFGRVVDSRSLLSVALSRSLGLSKQPTGS